MESRPEYDMQLVFNARILKRVVIDQHYRKKHPEVDDQLILRLVKTLDHGNYEPEKVVGAFEYYTLEPIELEGLPYRLVLMICVHDDFLGVVNAFRVRRKRK